MPFTPAQIAIGTNYSLETYSRKDPIDQINKNRPTLEWLIKNKESSLFGNGYCNERIHVSNGSNYQNYFGSDAVTYNDRDPNRLAKFAYSNFHDGFGFDEDTLAANGIIVTEDKEAVASGAEKIQLSNLLKSSYYALKNSSQDGLNLELLQDGSSSTKTCKGLDHLVSTTPSSGTVGNILASNAYWQNNANLAIATANLLDEMEESWRACILYGGQMPDYITAGAAFIDAYRAACVGLTTGVIQRQVTVSEKGGVGADGSISGLFFKGIPIVWDPSFETLDALLGVITYPWTKRCYFLNSNSVKLRPMTGHWMVNRKPEKLPDRYFHYWGMTSKYGMTTNKRNSNAVLSIA